MAPKNPWVLQQCHGQLWLSFGWAQCNSSRTETSHRESSFLTSQPFNQRIFVLFPITPLVWSLLFLVLLGYVFTWPAFIACLFRCVILIQATFPVGPIQGFMVSRYSFESTVFQASSHSQCFLGFVPDCDVICSGLEGHRILCMESVEFLIDLGRATHSTCESHATSAGLSRSDMFSRGPRATRSFIVWSLHAPFYEWSFSFGIRTEFPLVLSTLNHITSFLFLFRTTEYRLTLFCK